MSAAPDDFSDLLDHHRQTIERLVDRHHDDPDVLAIIVGGSIMKGRGRPDSDVDVMFLFTNDAFARRERSGELFYFDSEIAGYPGGYVDGKVFPMAYLHDAAESASEPTRWAFCGARLALCRIDDLRSILAAIARYPEREREAKMRSFAAQVWLHAQFFIREALKRGDPYLLNHAAHELVLFAGRYVLAYNRILFPSHKWFLTEVRSASEKPDGFVDHLEAMLREPSVEAAQRIYDDIGSLGAPLDQHGMLVQKFMEDIEWTWRSHKPALQDS